MKSFEKVSVKTYTPKFVFKNFSVFSEEYIKIRSNLSYKGNTCFICDKKFSHGESICLISLLETSNKVICNTCADYILDGSPPLTFNRTSLKKPRTLVRNLEPI